MTTEEPSALAGGWIAIDGGYASIAGLPEKWCVPLLVAASLVAGFVTEAEATAILSSHPSDANKDAMLLAELLRSPPHCHVELPPIQRVAKINKAVNVTSA